LRPSIIDTTNIILGGKMAIQAEVIIRGGLLRTYPSSSASEKQGIWWRLRLSGIVSLVVGES
jgi:hypothetical protein